MGISANIEKKEALLIIVEKYVFLQSVSEKGVRTDSPSKKY